MNTTFYSTLTPHLAVPAVPLDWLSLLRSEIRAEIQTGMRGAESFGIFSRETSTSHRSMKMSCPTQETNHLLFLPRRSTPGQVKHGHGPCPQWQRVSVDNRQPRRASPGRGVMHTRKQITPPPSLTSSVPPRPDHPRASPAPPLPGRHQLRRRGFTTATIFASATVLLVTLMIRCVATSKLESDPVPL